MGGFSLVGAARRSRTREPLWCGRVGVLRGNPLAGVVIEGYPFGSGIARPIGDVPGAEQVPLAIESHYPCPVVGWQVEAGYEVALDFGCANGEGALSGMLPGHLY